MFKTALMLLLMVSFATGANEDALTVDRVVSGQVQLAFPNENNVQPQLSDFLVSGFVLMSNDAGERWAVVTVTNQASGRRDLTNKHIMALVADGQRILPHKFLQSFKASETLSVTINFGESKFPLLSVYSRTDT